MNPKGVLVIVLDSFRADHLSEGARSTTPYLAGLASRGTVFERAVAPAAWTLPSHVSMLTGLSPTEHGIQSRGGVRPTLAAARDALDGLVRAERYLPAWLQERAVATFLGSSIGWLSPASGLGRGFDEVAFVPFPPRKEGARSAAPGKGGVPPAPRSLRGLPVPVKHAAKMSLEKVAEVRRTIPLAKWLASGEDKGASQLGERFARWISGVNGPFFALINLIETHDPHIAPRGYGRRDLGSIRAALAGKTFTRKMNLHNWGYRSLPSSELERLKRAYRAETSYADRCVRELVSHLTGAGLLEDTTLVITADHGESLGEHGLIGHGIPLSESVLNVPLIVAGPGSRPSRIDEPVGLGALASSVAETIVGELGPFGSPSLLRAEGRGRARAEVEAPGRYFHTSGLKLRDVPAHMDRPAAAFYDGSLKLIVGSFWQEALYDLDEDPFESDNLFGRRSIPSSLQEMRAEWEGRVDLA